MFDSPFCPRAKAISTKDVFNERLLQRHHSKKFLGIMCASQRMLFRTAAVGSPGGLTVFADQLGLRSRAGLRSLCLLLRGLCDDAVNILDVLVLTDNVQTGPLKSLREGFRAILPNFIVGCGALISMVEDASGADLAAAQGGARRAASEPARALAAATDLDFRLRVLTVRAPPTPPPSRRFGPPV